MDDSDPDGLPHTDQPADTDHELGDTDVPVDEREVLCVPGDVRAGSLGCGPNGSGHTEETCVDGAWVQGTECLSADACDDGVVRPGTFSCGFNYRGAFEEICRYGEWQVSTRCVDTDVCTDGSERPSASACGVDGTGRWVERCELGRWMVTATCGGEAACAAGAVQPGEVSCGLNDRGSLEQACLGGAWVTTERCVDPDVCEDGATQPGPAACGLNARGRWREACVAGAWLPTSSCEDLDVCVDGARKLGDTPCGLNGRGALEATCVGGTWLDSDRCEDADVCVDEEVREGEACDAVGFVHRERCLQGAWLRSEACVASCGDVVLDAEVRAYSDDDLVLLQGVTRITGDLNLLDGITSLASLAELRCVDGNVFVQRNANLEGLGGLERLRRVGRSMYVTDNASLRDLSSLEQLVIVGDLLEGSTLLVHENAELAELALPTLELIPDRVVVSSNGALRSVRVGGRRPEHFAHTPPDFLFDRNAQLSSITGVGASPKIGTLQLTANALVDLSGFSDLSSVSLFTIRDEPLLESLDGLEALGTGERAVGSLYLSGLDALTDLSALSNLTQLTNRLRIEELPAITSLEGLHNLTIVGDSVWLKHLENLEDLSGLRGLQRVGGRIDTLYGGVELEALPKVESFQDFGDHLASDALRVVDLPRLASIEGLSPGGAVRRLRLVNLPAITSLLSLSGALAPDLSEILVEDLPQLSNLAGLEGVETVEDLVLEDLPMLSTLGGWGGFPGSGLGSLAFVDTLILARAPEVDGIDALTSLTEARVISIGPVSAGFSFAGSRPLSQLASLKLIGEVGEDLVGLEVLDIRSLSIASQRDPFVPSSIVSLAGLERAASVPSVSLSDAPDLRDVSALAGVAHEVAVVSNTGLTDLTGLGASGDLEVLSIFNHEWLESLDGLSGVGGKLRLSLQNNAALRDIDVLFDGMSGLALGVEILDNPLLPQCRVDELFGVLDARGFAGSATTSGNSEAPVCTP